MSELGKELARASKELGRELGKTLREALKPKNAGSTQSGGSTGTSKLDYVMRKFTYDPKVSEITRSIGPKFPMPGAHYDYADFIEHIRYSAYSASLCDINDLLTYHLPEIYKRKNRLLEALAKARNAGVITAREYNHAYKHIDETYREWVRYMKEAFNKCVCKKP